MDKRAIKEFAVWARKKLLSEVQAKAYRIGINEKEILRPLSISTATVQFFDIGTDQPSQISGKEIKQRNNLVEKIQGKAKSSDYQTAYASIMEQVAYTWFNRLIAIRFMEVNDYLPSQLRVLSSVIQGKREPDLVTTPFDAGFEYTDQEIDLIQAYQEKNQLDALFRLLFIKQCNELNQILPELFEQTEDYTEMLLTINYTDTDGVVSHLVHDISEDDFKEAVEIIGWLYQYYNIEPKDEAFALLKKNVKITKERIPAATQLFTPEWIVRYMVENSLGRYWTDGHSDTNLKQEWSYYIEEAPQEERVEEQLKQLHQQHREQSLEAIKLIDPCMGSGHILVYAFDVLMQLYESQGYTARDAVQSIVENNLYGLELDDRAYQLAYFAIMMKARQHDRRAFSRNLKPQVYAIKESNNIDLEAIKYFNTTNEQQAIFQQLKSLHTLFIDAKEYGSILSVPNYDWEQIETYLDTLQYSTQVSLDELYAKQTIKELHQLIKAAKLLANKYEIVVTNPPYMGNSGMNADLSKYVKEHYPDSKTDLFAVFIERCAELTKDKGYQAMITQHSWMFLSSFENLRKKLQTRTIMNMAHLGARAFEEIGGEVVQTTSFIYCKEHIDNYQGTYCRLIEPTTQQGKEDMFLAKENRYVSKQDNFSKIPGEPIAYWVSEGLREAFKANLLYDYSISPSQNITGNNEKYVRKHWELEKNKIGELDSWIFYAKGGGFRKWYGNLFDVVNWTPLARQIYQFGDGKHASQIINQAYWYKKGITWGLITSMLPSFRVMPEGATFDKGGSTIIVEEKAYYLVLGLLNSKVYLQIATILNPTLNFQVKDIRSTPLLFKESRYIENFVKKNIDLSQFDWNSCETSWDFKKHPLI